MIEIWAERYLEFGRDTELAEKEASRQRHLREYAEAHGLEHRMVRSNPRYEDLFVLAKDATEAAAILRTMKDDYQATDLTVLAYDSEIKALRNCFPEGEDLDAWVNIQPKFWRQEMARILDVLRDERDHLAELASEDGRQRFVDSAEWMEAVSNNIEYLDALLAALELQMESDKARR